jgi:hypothetical protein
MVYPMAIALQDFFKIETSAISLSIGKTVMFLYNLPLEMPNTPG